MESFINLGVEPRLIISRIGVLLINAGTRLGVILIKHYEQSEIVIKQQNR